MAALKIALLNLWTRPRSTMDELINMNGKPYLWLVVLSGIGLRLDQASNGNLGDRTATDYIIVTSFIIGPIIGLIAWLLYSGLSHLLIRAFGGYGDWAETRRVFAWSTVPLVAKLFLWVPLLTIYGDYMFSSATPSGLGYVSFFLLIGLLEFILIGWFFVILSQGLSEVHSISAWKSFWSVILLPFTLFILVFLFALITL
ncbi:YIP1 family protein [Salinithrix halophila]|uniref:YIP1 family protein n=1 Tax=Salinithrix halophila TaxID=1485204 RepID=A0ABV8J9C7_9BACL